MNRMSVQDRYENDPTFRVLVEMMMSWLMNNAHYTPTELREAAMYAAYRVESLTIRRPFQFTKEGTIL